MILLKELAGGICSIKDVKANGVRGDEYGLAIIDGSGKAVGVFTNNKVQAAPVKFTSRLLRENNRIDNIIANSGCANAFTGKKGLKDAEWMSDLLRGETAVCSTGLIGKKISRELIREKTASIKDNLINKAEGSENAANAIRTTDTFTKEVAVKVGDVKIGGIAKGSGMIEPNMGTMLSFLYSNADFSTDFLEKTLKKSVNQSFNMIVVDGDTSTNDSVLLVSTERKKDCNKQNFQKALNYVCEELAKMIAEDGEGSTKFIEAKTIGARNKREAKSVSKEIIKSPLVKTMFYGESSNVGRIVSAVGNSESYVEENEIEIKINDEKIIADGEIVASSSNIKKLVSEEKISVETDLGLGESKAKAWGCDLSPDYVKINAGYG